MTAFEWIAVVGAAAWLPQIGLLVYRVMVKPKLYFIPDREIELGYTNYGPIINIRAAVFSQRKDAVIEEMTLVVKHEKGRTINLAWHSFIEKFSDIRSATGETAEVSRDQVATALKISTTIPTEKFIRFQDPVFQRKWRSLVTEVENELTRLKEIDPNPAERLLKSKEYRELTQYLEHYFPWESGRYEIELRVKILALRGQVIGRSSFTLSPAEVDKLRATIDTVERGLEDIVKNVPPEDRKYAPYFWANPLLPSKDLGLKRKPRSVSL